MSNKGSMDDIAQRYLDVCDELETLRAENKQLNSNWQLALKIAESYALKAERLQADISKEEIEKLGNRHVRGDYASLSGDGVTLDKHICEYDRRDWPCDAYILFNKIKQIIEVP